MPGVLLGTVASRETRRFGPLPGTWRDIAEIIARNAGGREAGVIDRQIDLDYDLGQVPEAMAYVFTSWRSPTPTAGSGEASGRQR